MVRRKHRHLRHFAVSQNGASLAEVMVVAAIIIVLAAAFAIPSFRQYASSRASSDAAATLAEDIGFLERSAQNSHMNEGATLLVDSDDPLSYRGYLGRPSSVDSNSSLGALVLQRRFPGVALTAGPINPATPLLFARNGSAQYVDASGAVAPQHETIEFGLGNKEGARTATVDLNLFTGAVSIH